MRRRFKEKSHQACYDWYMTNRPGKEGRGQGAAGNAYYVGRFLPDPHRPFVVKGSFAYAAWAAGIDTAREEGRIKK